MADIVRFMRARHIDSFQKLRVLYFLHKHTGSSWTGRQIAERLYLGDWLLVEQIISELRAAGLISCEGRHCQLCLENGVRSLLERLAYSYEDPLVRQEILKEVGHAIPYHRTDVYEWM